MPYGNHLRNIEAFCGDADGVYYSDPHAVQDEIAFTANIGTNWHASYVDGWTHCNPLATARRPPGQGWKVHISSVPHQCEEVLQIVSGYCTKRNLYFKHLPDRAAFSRNNAKYAARNSSGKFITIYPNPDELESVLEDLEALLHLFEGPYILSDIRWRRAPIFLRYGGFVRAATIVDGRLTPAIRDVNGEWV